jgi:long-chain acyl-CoA synthetase
LSKQPGGKVYRSMSWEDVEEQVAALSIFFVAQQINAGDRILIYSENRPEWGIADLAILSLGAWTVPVYPTLAPEDLRTICKDCRPSLAITSTPEQAALVLDACGAAAAPKTVIVLQPGAAQSPQVVPWAAALSRGREMQPKLRNFLEHRLRQLKPEDTATLIYTSGTTGEPKGVMLSHTNLLSNVESSLQVIQLHSRDQHLSFLPLSHVFERMAGWYLMLAAGASIAYAESMDTVAEDMAIVRPTVMLGVPRFFEKFYDRIQEGIAAAPPKKQRLARWAIRVGRAMAARRLAGRFPSPVLAVQHVAASRLVFWKFRARLGGRLRFFVSGSAPLSKEIGEFFYSIGVIILEGYGLTETSPVIAVNDPSEPTFGTVGRPIPGVEVRLAEDGEILTRGPHVMQGYYQKAAATAEVLRDGWFHTGDIGHLDAAGRLCITDRKKDLIKTAGGKFVAPQKLESLFVSDPLISQAFIYGDKRPYCVALIVPKYAALRAFAQERGIACGSGNQELVRHPRVIELLWQRIQEHQRGLAGFEQVKKIAVLDQEFSQSAGELTPTMKARRGAIAQRYAKLLDTLYAAAAPAA